MTIVPRTTATSPAEAAGSRSWMWRAYRHTRRSEEEARRPALRDGQGSGQGGGTVRSDPLSGGRWAMPGAGDHHLAPQAGRGGAAPSGGRRPRTWRFWRTTAPGLNRRRTSWVAEQAMRLFVRPMAHPRTALGRRAGVRDRESRTELYPQHCWRLLTGEIVYALVNRGGGDFRAHVFRIPSGRDRADAVLRRAGGPGDPRTMRPHRRRSAQAKADFSESWNVTKAQTSPTGAIAMQRERRYGVWPDGSSSGRCSLGSHRAA